MRHLAQNSARYSLLLIASAELATALGHAANDEVLLNKGKPVTGTIREDTISGVKIQMAAGGGEMTLTASDIKGIEWDIGNNEFQQGLSEMKRGAFSSAATSFQMITGEKETLEAFRDVAKPYLFYMVGECLYKSGKPKEAMDAFEKLIADYKNSRYVPMATESMVDVCIQVKNFKKAQDLLKQLETLGAEQKAKAIYFSAAIDRETGNIDGANTKYGDAANATNDPETKALARLGQAHCAVQKKDLGKAKQMAEQAVNSATPSVAAMAHTIIGDVLFEEGNAQTGDPSKDKFLDAVLEYMRVPVLYTGDRMEAYALFRTGECFSRLYKFPGRGQDKDRALSMYGEVMSRFKGSRWATQAQESMKKVK